MQTVLLAPRAALAPTAAFDATPPALVLTPAAEIAAAAPDVQSGLPGREAEDCPDSVFATEMDKGPGAFVGLRVALLFNLGFAVAGLIAYELWTILQQRV